MKASIKIVVAPLEEDAIALAMVDTICFGKEAMTKKEWMKALAERATVFYAFDGETRIGAAVLMETSFNLGYLYSTAIIPPYRRMGVGRQLLKARVLYGYEHEISRFQAHTRVDNIPSGRLLQTEGFKAISYIPDFYDEFEDGILWQNYS